MYYTKSMKNEALLVFCFSLFLFIQKTSALDMSCRYGERGSLTAICTNVTANYFKDTPYRFDHLDETLLCINCTLPQLKSGTFDISGNRIQILSLTDSKIEFIEEKAFTGLVFLERLILSHNSISSIEVGAFHGARKIKEIYLDNALTAPLVDYVLRDLWKLKVLNISNNGLTRLENKSFFGAENLEMLDLSCNKLRELNNSLIYLKSLKVLLLNNNEILKITPTDFQNLQNMLKTDLSDNLIGNITFKINQPNKLRELILSNNHLGNKAVKVGAFEELSNLEILDLSLNWFTVIPPKLFLGLYKLRELILYKNTIHQFKSGAFSGLPALRLINVSHNYIQSAEITGQLSLRQLHIIDLSDNRIYDFDFVKFLQRAPKITKVDLRGNLLSCEKLRKLEDYLKNESIQYNMDLKNCPKLDPEAAKQIFLDLQNKIDNFEKRSPVVKAFKILFLIIIIFLTGVLYYNHFFVLNRKNY